MVDFINVYALLEETALDTASVAEVVIKYELVIHCTDTVLL